MQLDLCKSYEEVSYKLNESSKFIYILKDSPICICAPHHTKEGTVLMYDNFNGKKFGDQNTGYVALDIAKSLNSSLVIASHPTHDPNKKNGVYTGILLASKADIITEIHSHWKINKDKYIVTNNDIEVSTGSKDLEYFAKLLAYNLIAYLPNKKISGDFDRIYYKAKKTESLRICRQNKILPIHIEIFKDMITSESLDLQNLNIGLNDALVNVLGAYLKCQ